MPLRDMSDDGIPFSDEELKAHWDVESAEILKERAEHHGRLIKRRRLELGLKRPAFVAEMEKLGLDMTADYLNKLEAGSRFLSNASPKLRDAIRQVLGYSLEEWAEATGLYIPPHRDNGSEPRGGPPIPPRLPPVELPLEIPPNLQAAIDKYGDDYPEFRNEQNLRAITSLSRYGGAGDPEPHQWLEILLTNRRWLVKN